MHSITTNKSFTRPRQRRWRMGNRSTDCHRPGIQLQCLRCKLRHQTTHAPLQGTLTPNPHAASHAVHSYRCVSQTLFTATQFTAVHVGCKSRVHMYTAANTTTQHRLETARGCFLIRNVTHKLRKSITKGVLPCLGVWKQHAALPASKGVTRFPGTICGFVISFQPTPRGTVI
jgi:hypothetical protein